MLYIEVDERDFIRAFEDVDRIAEFSNLGLKYLFDYYRELAEDLPGGIGLDPIGICCEWGELSAVDLIREYGYLIDWTEEYRPYDSEAEDCEQFGELIEYLQDNGNLIIVDHISQPNTYLFSE